MEEGEGLLQVFLEDVEEVEGLLAPRLPALATAAGALPPLPTAAGGLTSRATV